MQEDEFDYLYRKSKRLIYALLVCIMVAAGSTWMVIDAYNDLVDRYVDLVDTVNETCPTVFLPKMGSQWLLPMPDYNITVDLLKGGS